MMFRRLDRALDGSAIRVLSVDCFDTLLLRNGRPEHQRFYRLACRLENLSVCRNYGINARALLRSRIHAMEIAYRTAPLVDAGREAHIAHILRVQLNWLGLDESWSDEFLRVELEAEAASLRPNLHLADFCRRAAVVGLRVVVTSDMYLGSASINWLLIQHGLGAIPDKIYVSAECSATKRGGGLFQLIAEREGVKLGQIMHLGDCRHSDYLMPKSLGMRSHWVPRARHWRALQYVRGGLTRFRFRSLRVTS